MDEAHDQGAPPDLPLDGLMAGRELHVHVRKEIRAALGGRSWKWLAGRIDVPQSTLASQVSRPKFSLEVVRRSALVLGLDPRRLLGLPRRESDFQ